MYLGKDPTNFLLDELVVFTLHCEIEYVMEKKITIDFLPTCLNILFTFFQNQVLRYDFIHIRTSTTHWAKF